MAGSASVFHDNGRYSAIGQRLVSAEKLLALVSGIAVFSLMVLAMPLIAFMGVAYVQREGGHIRMDNLIGRQEGRALLGGGVHHCSSHAHPDAAAGLGSVFTFRAQLRFWRSDVVE